MADDSLKAKQEKLQQQEAEMDEAFARITQTVRKRAARLSALSIAPPAPAPLPVPPTVEKKAAAG